MNTITGAEAFVQLLRSAGARYLFGVPGTSGADILGNILPRQDLQYVLGLHEASVVAMADGYARASGEPAFVNVSTLPGTANTIGALYDAFRDGSPVVVTSTQQDTRILGRDTHTETADLVEVTRQFTKWSWEVPRADRIAEALVRAVKVATAPPTGPVFLSIPANFFAEPVPADLPDPGRYRVSPCIPPDPAGIQRAAELLVSAERPLLVAGRGVVQSGGSAELLALAEALALPMVPEPRHSFLPFPPRHPLAFRTPDRTVSFELPGVGAPDVILAIGCRLFREYRFHPTPPIGPGTLCIHVNDDPWEIGKLYPADVGLVADARSALVALAEATRALIPQAAPRIAARRALLAEAKAQVNAAVEAEAASGADAVPIKPWHLARALDAELGPDAIVVNESPTSKRFLMTHIGFSRPDAYLSNSSGGYLGWGLGAALGVALARPDRRVVAAVGDGSFMFGNQALWTAARYRIPVLAVVLNNHGYMAVKNQWRWKHAEERLDVSPGTDFVQPEINFVRLAEAFELVGERVEKPAGLRDALRRALAWQRPGVLDVVIEQVQD